MTQVYVTDVRGRHGVRYTVTFIERDGAATYMLTNGDTQVAKEFRTLSGFMQEATERGVLHKGEGPAEVYAMRCVARLTRRLPATRQVERTSMHMAFMKAIDGK